MSNEFSEEMLTLEIDGMQIPAALSVPSEKAVDWAILLIPGSLFSDVNGDYPGWNIYPHMYADLAHQLAGRGHAVLRYAKTGPGTGSVVVDAEKAKAFNNFNERVAVAAHAFDVLKQHAPSARAYSVAGHSEGALVGTLLCPQLGSQVAAYISLSGPALRIFDIMTGQNEAQAGPEAGQLYRKVIEHFRKQEPVSPELKQEPSLKMFLQFMDEAAISYLRSEDLVDPCEAIAQVTCPALLVQGGHDNSVRPEQVEQLLAARQGLNTSKAFFPELQHFYKPVEPGTPAMAAFGLTGPTDERVSVAIHQWLESL